MMAAIVGYFRGAPVETVAPATSEKLSGILSKIGCDPEKATAVDRRVLEATSKEGKIDQLRLIFTVDTCPTQDGLKRLAQLFPTIKTVHFHIENPKLQDTDESKRIAEGIHKLFTDAFPQRKKISYDGRVEMPNQPVAAVVKEPESTNEQPLDTILTRIGCDPEKASDEDKAALSEFAKTKIETLRFTVTITDSENDIRPTEAGVKKLSELFPDVKEVNIQVNGQTAKDMSELLQISEAIEKLFTGAFKQLEQVNYSGQTSHVVEIEVKPA